MWYKLNQLMSLLGFEVENHIYTPRIFNYSNQSPVMLHLNYALSVITSLTKNGRSSVRTFVKFKWVTMGKNF